MKLITRTALVAGLSALPLHAGTTPSKAPTKSIVQTAVDSGSFSTLVAAVQAADLVEAFQGHGPFTVFAPTDEAFAKLPKDTLNALLLPGNKGKLTEILTYHVVSGQVSAKDAVAVGEAPSLQKSELGFAINGGKLQVNDANVVQNDVLCSNGVIHAIDSVLLPPGGLDLAPAGNLIIGVNIERPSRALAAQLELDRHGSLVLTSVSSGNPAARAGLEKYDILTSIDGKPASSDELKKAKERVGFGGTLQLAFLRRGEMQHVEVEVGIDPH